MVREKIKTIAILAVIYLLYTDGSSFGFSTDSAWWTHFTYPFFHGSWIHLIGNCYAFWFVYSNRIFKQYTLPIIITIAIAASFLTEMKMPTVGFSGVIFAMGGINSAYRKCKLKNIIPILIALSIGFLLPNTNGMIHLVSFMIAYIFSSVYQSINNYYAYKGLTRRE